MVATAAPTVVYIGGLGRSGTTLLERMLGQVPGWCSVGELVHMWHRGLLDDERCGCGEPFSRCPFWTAVGLDAFGGWDRVDVAEMLRLKESVDRNRYIAAMLLPWLLPAYRRRLAAYSAVVTRLYGAIATASGCHTVIDSSKHPSFAYLLRRARGVRLRVVHVVRDSRAVAFSWGTRVRRPEVVDGEAYMTTYSPVKVGVLWNVHNLLFELLARVGAPTVVVRYEDLLAAPERELRRILRLVEGEPEPAALDFVGPTHVDLAPGHTVAGNPMRFSAGRVELRFDERWRSGLPPSRRRLVSAATWPLRTRYRYAAATRD